jgi:FkbM family methyltransferase
MAVRRAMRRVLPQRLALALRREWLARQVVSGRAYREGEVDGLATFVQPTDVCWDIGANSGTYTIALSRLASRVVAFEPIPHNFQILEAVTRRGKLANVTIERIAISDASGSARMSVPVEGFYGGYYLAALDAGGNLPVETASIDDLIARGYPEPAFIKCDVEGVEERVLKGAHRLIERRHPIWLLETFDDPIVPLAHSLGYATFVTQKDGRLERVPARLATHRNYWLVPESAT